MPGLVPGIFVLSTADVRSEAIHSAPWRDGLLRFARMTGDETRNTPFTIFVDRTFTISIRRAFTKARDAAGENCAIA
jgi:hypothetical protein